MAIENGQLSVREMMKAVKLKDKKKLLFALIMATQVFTAKAGDIITLPKQDMNLDMTLMTALQNRHSSREFYDREISDSTLATVLWAACGIFPPFIAQHATGCCCSGCLLQWYGIEKGRQLILKEQDYITQVIIEWLRRHH